MRPKLFALTNGAPFSQWVGNFQGKFWSLRGECVPINVCEHDYAEINVVEKKIIFLWYGVYDTVSLSSHAGKS